LQGIEASHSQLFGVRGMNTLAAPRVDAHIVSLSEYAELFPLPLTFFEHFMLQDEHPGYPMVFYVEMVFLGRMNHEALTEAIQEAARHPLLLARKRIVEDYDGRSPSPGPRRFSKSTRPLRSTSRRSDRSARESGLRVWVQEDAEPPGAADSSCVL
jgi:hypothetical protein